MITPRPARSLGLIRAALLLIPCAVLLSACDAAPISDERFSGLPEGVNIDQPLQSSLVKWKHKPESLTVTTWGSSSCPLTATDMTTGAENELTISFETVSDGDCTADLSPTTHVFSLPDEAQYSPLTVKISTDGVISPEETVLN